jgi:hypothetical protein
VWSHYWRSLRRAISLALMVLYLIHKGIPANWCRTIEDVDGVESSWTGSQGCRPDIHFTSRPPSCWTSEWQ